VNLMELLFDKFDYMWQLLDIDLLLLVEGSSR
jgi:hypothetical protein